MRIAVLDDYQEVAQSMVDWGEAVPGAEVVCFSDHFADPAGLAEAVAGCEVIVAMRERTAFGAAVLGQLPDLKLLVTTGMRNASIDVGAARALGIEVCGTRAHPASTAELTWALILALVRGVAADDALVRSGGWQARVARDLDGATLGIVGLGRQGSRVAAVARAFGMEVVAWSPHLTPERCDGVGARLSTKAELLARADVVTLHMPLNPQTAGLITADELESMRRDAYLVNTARWGLLADGALRSALEHRWIAGAGLDVYDVEPLPAEHWLRNEPRVLLSPHMGYVSRRNYELFYGDAAEDIAAFGAGAPIRTLALTEAATP
jgi:phosphoglycerate dehydrogenase-like enzyme